jgi:hypothetical protein
MMAKGRKTKKAKQTKPAKRAKKTVKRTKASASRGRAKKSKPAKAGRRKPAPRKAAPRKAVKARRPAAKKAAPKKKKQIVGEGDYQASRSFLKDQSDFVHRHSGEIPKMGKEAEAALDGPEGGELRAAEEEARSHSKSPNEE